jgi:zinc transporter 1/2/3
MTLAVDDDFVVLFIVLIFHRKRRHRHHCTLILISSRAPETFEGLGLGTRLASLELPPSYRTWVPYVGALIYGFTTPVGIAAGLGIRSTYNPGSTTSSIVGGVFDSLSAGILLYTGLVEVRTHKPTPLKLY